MGRGAFVRGVVASCVLALAAGAANADPYTDFLDGVEAEIESRLAEYPLPEDRLPEERREYAALARCAALLDRASADEAADLALLRKIIATLRKPFPEDPELQVLYAGALAPFRAVLGADWIGVTDAIDTIDDDRLGLRLVLRLVRFTIGLARADAEDDPGTRAGLLRKSWKAMGKLRLQAVKAMCAEAGGESVGLVTIRVDGVPVHCPIVDFAVAIDGVTGETTSFEIGGGVPDAEALAEWSHRFLVRIGTVPDGLPGTFDFENAEAPGPDHGSLVLSTPATTTSYDQRSAGQVRISKFKRARIRLSGFTAGTVAGLVEGTFRFVANTEPDGSGDEVEVAAGRFVVCNLFAAPGL